MSTARASGLTCRRLFSPASSLAPGVAAARDQRRYPAVELAALWDSLPRLCRCAVGRVRLATFLSWRREARCNGIARIRAYAPVYQPFGHLTSRKSRQSFCLERAEEIGADATEEEFERHFRRIAPPRAASSDTDHVISRRLSLRKKKRP